jgi:hypothetical protein
LINASISLRPTVLLLCVLPRSVWHGEQQATTAVASPSNQAGGCATLAFRRNVVDLSVDIAAAKRSLTLANPVMVASGTFSYGVDYPRVFDIQRLGAIVSKTTTLRPRAGSPTPRIDETPAGMLNSIGLQNIGVDRVIRDMAPVWERWRVPVIVSILGSTVE